MQKPLRTLALTIAAGLCLWMALPWPREAGPTPATVGAEDHARRPAPNAPGADREPPPSGRMDLLRVKNITMTAAPAMRSVPVERPIGAQVPGPTPMAAPGSSDGRGQQADIQARMRAVTTAARRNYDETRRLGASARSLLRAVRPRDAGT